jgi:hypothetical protein
MKRSSFSVAIMVLITALVNGCGKKEPETVPAPAGETSTTVATQPASQPQAGAPAASTQASVNSRLTDAQAAMKAKDYERAVATLLAVQNQRQPLSVEQAQAVRNQMVQLQQNVAAGVASGDPKAKAAAEMLRQSTMR